MTPELFLIDMREGDDEDEIVDLIMGRIAAQQYEWDESKHPRDKEGRWTDSEGILHGGETSGPIESSKPKQISLTRALHDAEDEIVHEQYENFVLLGPDGSR